MLELLQTLYKQQSDCPINEDLSGSGGGDATVSGGGYSTMSTSSLIEEIENDISLLAKFLHNFYADDPNLQHLVSIDCRLALAVNDYLMVCVLY